MSALIGIDWPVNSVGVLPDVDPTRPGYLTSVDADRTQANAALINVQVCDSKIIIKSPTHSETTGHT